MVSRTQIVVNLIVLCLKGFCLHFGVVFVLAVLLHVEEMFHDGVASPTYDDVHVKTARHLSVIFCASCIFVNSMQPVVRKAPPRIKTQFKDLAVALRYTAITFTSVYFSLLLICPVPVTDDCIFIAVLKAAAYFMMEVMAATFSVFFTTACLLLPLSIIVAALDLVSFIDSSLSRPSN